MTAATRFGKPLPAGGTIGVPAPASPWENRSELLRGIEWWEGMGYTVKLGDGILERSDYVAGSPETRGRDVTAMFADPEVDVVQCFQGGYGSAQTIPFVDFNVIAANPKPFIGYSDITALHVAIRQRTGLATIYGYGLAGVNDGESTDFSRQRLLKVLREDSTGPVPPNPDDPWVRAISGGKVTAPLVGGCLWLLMQTMGTPWEIETDGCILFFEDVDAPAWYVDGNLTQLKQAGKLDGVVGVVVGEMDKCDWREARPEWPRTKSLEDVLELHLEPLGVPVIYRLPLGHGKHLAALPLGVTATLDADARTLTIDEPALR
ncbi:MAG TPA: LD-carboxypeptidase [Gaiellaceae bacterium]